MAQECQKNVAGGTKEMKRVGSKVSVQPRGVSGFWHFWGMTPRVADRYTRPAEQDLFGDRQRPTGNAQGAPGARSDWSDASRTPRWVPVCRTFNVRYQRGEEQWKI